MHILARSSCPPALLVALAIGATGTLGAQAPIEDGGSSPRTTTRGSGPVLEPGLPPPPIAPDTISRGADGGATIRAVPVRELVVDGTLDEPVYRTTPPFGDFIQLEPEAGELATERTEAWVFFDDTNLYVAVRASDAAPESEWVANDMQRDSFNIGENESFAFVLDTFYDRRNGFFFNVNPIGGRQDGQVANEGRFNGDWNPVWTVKTGRFEGGWSFEAAVPFKSIRYRPGDGQVWGLQMRRRVRHKNEDSYLTRLDPGVGRLAIFQISQSATLVGLEVPPGGPLLEVKPYVIGDVRSDLLAAPATSNDPSGNIGLDIKYGITENLTADFTVNTDFAQVEADEQQVNLTRFSLFFPEKREFFLENQGTFGFGGGGGPFGGGGDTPTLFYSRRIGLNEGREVPIVAGGRLTGRLGAFRLGFINVRTDEESVSNAAPTTFTVARLTRDVLRRSSIGALVTHRSVVSDGTGSSQTYGIDGIFGFYDNLAINTYWATTQSPGHREHNVSYKGQLRYSGDRYGVSAEHLLVDKQFDPAVGFLRRDDFRRSSASVRFSPRPQSIAAVRKFTWDGNYDYITDTAGMVETRQARGRFQTEFESSDTIEASFTNTYDFLKAPFVIAPEVTIPAGGYNFWSARVAASFGVGTGG